MFPLDSDILHLVQSGIRPWLTPIMQTVSWVFTPEAIVPALLAVLLALFFRHQRKRELLLILLLAGNVLTLILKPAFHRSRPTAAQATVIGVQPDYSFPSGHAMAVVTIVTAALLVPLHRGQRPPGWLISLASFFVLLVGYSRVYLGAHWPSDVVAGWLIGGLWSAAVWRYLLPITIQRYPGRR